MYYNKDKNSIDYIQKISFGAINNVNTEDVEYENISIGSLKGIKYINNGINTVVFADKTYMYTVYGKLPFEELVKMAESIKTE